MIRDLKNPLEIQTLPDEEEFEATNHLIHINILLIDIILESADYSGGLDAGFERYELESIISLKSKRLEKGFAPLLDLLFEGNHTVSIKTIKEFILNLKLSIIFERATNDLNT